MRKEPIAVESTNLSNHPACRAWTHAGGGGSAAIVELWRDDHASKPAIYRLMFPNPHAPPVFAKRFPAAGLALERRLYEEILPHLDVTIPRYYGFHEDETATGWLFIEDVGTLYLSAEDPEHRLLAGHWLGRLHRAAADVPAAASLPDAGPPRYLGHLRSGREKIRKSARNPFIPAEGNALLGRVLRLQDDLESRWQEIERVCEDAPSTLVHGDFQPKNVRIRAGNTSLALYAIDWETAGWGIPAADLAPRGPGRKMQVDPHAYQAEMSDRWPHVDAAMVARLSILGRVLRTLAAVDWATESLHFESVACLLDPLSSIRSYEGRLSGAMATAGEWLG